MCSVIKLTAIQIQDTKGTEMRRKIMNHALKIMH